MKKRILKITALIMALCTLASFVGCRKSPTSSNGSGEWLSERKYYTYDANGNWVEVADKSFFENGNVGNTDQETPKAVDSSKFQTLIDYCGNEKYDLVYKKSEGKITIDSYAAEVLEDDYRFRRHTKDEAYVMYKVDGIAEFLVQYCSGIGDRFASEVICQVSKDEITWTTIKPQDKVTQVFNGTSWQRYVSYYACEDTENKFLKIILPATGKDIYNPSINMVQINGLTDERLGELGAYNSAISTKTVYIDSQNGKDTNSGKTEKEPIKTLYAASKKTYAPGSKILLKAGCTFQGSLEVKGNGAAGRPITISSYGKGDKPIVSARGGNAISVYGEYINISGLKVTNKTGSRGIYIETTKPGAAKGFSITNCDFYDINTNFTNTAHSSGGINMTASGRQPAWFDGIKVENNTFNKVARGAVTVFSEWSARLTTQDYSNRNDISKGEWFPNKNIVVRGNNLNQVGGDAIMFIGADGALVEKNIAVDTGLFRDKGEIHWVTMWCHSSDNCIFQYNEIYGNSGRNNGFDLQAFDIDIACNNNIVQYNYSQDNEGGFVLFCTLDELQNVANRGNIVRYNLSVNDGVEGGMVFDFTGSIVDSQIYNNTIYCGKNNVKLVNFANYGNASKVSRNNIFTNNVFVAKSGVNVTYGTGWIESGTFKNNLFYNIDEPKNPKITNLNNLLNTDPKLASLGATGTGLQAMAKKYAPKAGSPVLSRGIAVANNGGIDMLGNKVTDKLMGAILK